MGDPTRFTVVLGVTGSIAAYKAPEIVRGLRALRDPAQPERRVDVRVILTESGAQFITPVTLRTVSGNPVACGMFDEPEQWDVRHVGLADDADVLLVAPASAQTIARLALGLADDLLASTALACTAPLIVAPAMNVHMWEHPATQANVATLSARGTTFVGPAEGELACGYSGRGRLAPVDAIVAAVARLFVAPALAACDLAGRHIVITAGPTREYLDPVRYISNPSTGKMGYALAAAARARGARVTLVSGPTTLAALAGVTVVPVVSAAEMLTAALAAAGDADAVIAAAAPVDFAPATRAPQKLKKGDRSTETLDMTRTEDIIAAVGARKRPGQVTAAFAAETEQLEEHARAKLASKHADLIVANDVSAADAGFGADTNRAVLLFADGRREELPLQSKTAMAHRILDAVAGLLR